MKRSMILAAALLIAGGLRADAKPLPAGTFNVDPSHSKFGFAVTHMVISTVEGKFDKFEGVITVKSPKEISVVASADTASVDTGNPMRDGHLRGDNAKMPKDDFFEAEKYPKLTFKSTKVTLADDNSLTVVGDLSIHGVTKSVTLTGKYKGAVQAYGQRIAANLATTISRKDFGLKFGAMVEAGPVVSDEVDLSINVEAVQAESKK
jgi:polyisoprenoid-binding protein YceI